MEFNLVSVSKLCVPAKELLFLMGVHLSVKNVLKNELFLKSQRQASFL